MRLSPHFTLKEFTRNRRGFGNVPPSAVVERLRWLCAFILEPIREKFGPVKINSGYRSPKFNRAVNGAKDSAHLGKDSRIAADLAIPGARLKDVFDWIRLESGLRFDKVILERGQKERHEWDDCIHIQIRSEPRRVAMLGETNNRGPYKVVEVK